MTTATAAFTVIKDRLIANQPAGLWCYRFQNEDEDTRGDRLLPDARAFAYVEFTVRPTRMPVAWGGGRYNNRYRNEARLTITVFVPRGEGLTRATDLSEQLATLFRSYRDDADTISCFGASVIPGGDGAVLSPPGLASDVNNYFYAGVEISLFFDQIG